MNEDLILAELIKHIEETQKDYQHRLANLFPPSREYQDLLSRLGELYSIQFILADIKEKNNLQ